MIQDSRKLLRALDNLTNETIHAEQYFTDELHLFFQYLCRKVLKELDLKNPLDSLFHLEPNNVIEKYWEEYDKIFSYYVDVGATIGNIHYDILLNASKAHAKEFASTKSRETVQSLLDYKFNSEDTDTLFKPDPKVSSRLKRYKFEASEKTKARVTEDINNILGEAYREGWGPRHVGEKIQERFNQLSGYEARRIAQTELNTTRNMVQYNRLKDDEMPYKIWHSAHDARTRKSHLDVDEEIVPIDEKFSNGLMYPGDKSGPIREWVNCRCSHAAFVMPLGYEAPSFFPFRESDLVKVGSSVSSSYIPELRERLGLVEGIVQGAVTERERQRVREDSTAEFTNPANLNKQQAQSLIDYQSKHQKHKIEYGNLMDIETGKSLYGEDIKGKKNGVKVPRPRGGNYGLLHNHPSESTFSGSDIKNMLEHEGQMQCYAVSPNGKYHVATLTKQGQYMKNQGIPESVLYEYLYGLDRIAREVSKELMDTKYGELFAQCKTRKEANQLRKEMKEEFSPIYNERVKEKYGPGKDELIEIHEYTKEELEHVIGNSD